ncbi:MAG: glutamate-5-semialdehyde dehydrogenase [Patescibacteria group bacterium]
MKHDIDAIGIRRAALALSRSSEADRNAFLTHLAAELKKHREHILAANRRDIGNAERAKLPEAFVARLALDAKGFEHIARKVLSVRSLRSGLGDVVEKRVEKNGLTFMKVRVPLGVLAIIYEARPEVTIDVAALSVKSGNAAVLKGGSAAVETNKALFACVRAALKKAKLPSAAIQFIATGDRAVTNALLKRHDVIDLVIARGGYGMVKSVMEESRIPILAHSSGGARIYVHKSADLGLAVKILVNAKVTKPAACNSLDTILVDRSIAPVFVSRVTEAMEAAGVRVKREMDWDEETLGLTVGIKVVKGLNEALAFIDRHSKRHTEGLIAKDASVVKRFLASVDAAALFVNASTRLHDGYVFGLGSEMGISTSKLHARGPVGLKELTSYKWEVIGHGDIRK